MGARARLLSRTVLKQNTTPPRLCCTQRTMVSPGGARVRQNHSKSPLFGHCRSRGGAVAYFRTVRDRSRARTHMDVFTVCPEISHCATLAVPKDHDLSPRQRAHPAIKRKSPENVRSHIRREIGLGHRLSGIRFDISNVVMHHSKPSTDVFLFPKRSIQWNQQGHHK